MACAGSRPNVSPPSEGKTGLSYLTNRQGKSRMDACGWTKKGGDGGGRKNVGACQATPRVISVNRCSDNQGSMEELSFFFIGARFCFADENSFFLRAAYF